LFVFKFFILLSCEFEDDELEVSMLFAPTLLFDGVVPVNCRCSCSFEATGLAFDIVAVGNGLTLCGAVLVVVDPTPVTFTL
jgi:hypothetical protein